MFGVYKMWEIISIFNVVLMLNAVTKSTKSHSVALLLYVREVMSAFDYRDSVV